ncbi:hypothetical protein ACTFIU_011299 [Dictyostelium citrinum]
MDHIIISQSSYKNTNNKFHEQYPTAFEGIISKEEFLKIIRNLNQYKSYRNGYLFFIIFILGGFAMLVAGAVLKGESASSFNTTTDKSSLFYISPEEKREKEYNGTILVIVGPLVLLTGIIMVGFSYYFSAASYKRNIKLELSKLNEIYKPIGIDWEFQRRTDKYYVYSIKITFLKPIERLENGNIAIHQTNLTVANPSSSEQKLSTGIVPLSNYSLQKAPSQDSSYSQYYPPSQIESPQPSAPYSQINSDEPSSSSSPTSSPLPISITKTPTNFPQPDPVQPPPYYYKESTRNNRSHYSHHEEAQSVPLPQEILDMIELEEKNAVKDV